jgi:hypothetical protein
VGALLPPPLARASAPREQLIPHAEIIDVTFLSDPKLTKLGLVEVALGKRPQRRLRRLGPSIFNLDVTCLFPNSEMLINLFLWAEISAVDFLKLLRFMALWNIKARKAKPSRKYIYRKPIKHVSSATAIVFVLAQNVI